MSVSSFMWLKFRWSKVSFNSSLKRLRPAQYKKISIPYHLRSIFWQHLKVIYPYELQVDFFMRAQWALIQNLWRKNYTLPLLMRKLGVPHWCSVTCFSPTSNIFVWFATGTFSSLASWSWSIEAVVAVDCSVVPSAWVGLGVELAVGFFFAFFGLLSFITLAYFPRPRFDMTRTQ